MHENSHHPLLFLFSLKKYLFRGEKNMTSVTLEDERGDSETIAKMYNNGNISKFIRDLIWNYHYKRIQIQIAKKTDNKIFLVQNTVFLFISASFIALGLSLKVDIVSSITVSLLVISAVLLVLLVIINHKKHRRINSGI